MAYFLEMLSILVSMLLHLDDLNFIDTWTTQYSVLWHLVIMSCLGCVCHLHL
jgi:hypothetical protein